MKLTKSSSVKEAAPREFPKSLEGIKASLGCLQTSVVASQALTVDTQIQFKMKLSF